MAIKKKKNESIAAYDNKEYLHSREARVFRVMAEFSEPEHRFEKNQIEDTIVFFGSARTLPPAEAKKRLQTIIKHKSSTPAQIKIAQTAVKMSRYYEDAENLSSRLSHWLEGKTHTFAICSGGGGGIMEAANRGASERNFPSIGLNISLPFEQNANPYITESLNFEFHYFFLRKFWFLYMAKAIIIFPGGFGTLDEMMEVLTLVQTQKLQKNFPIILFGKEYWTKVINFKHFADMGMIDPDDVNIFKVCETVDEAYKEVTRRLEVLLNDRKAPKGKDYTSPLVIDI